MTDHLTKEHSPVRVRLSRAKGWKMPENTVKVDRTTRLGNPFVVGKHGTAKYCVHLFRMLMGGLVCCSNGPGFELQAKVREAVATSLGEMRGKNLACWCKANQPCHADVLLEIFNSH